MRRPPPEFGKTVSLGNESAVTRFGSHGHSMNVGDRSHEYRQQGAAYNREEVEGCVGVCTVRHPSTKRHTCYVCEEEEESKPGRVALNFVSPLNGSESQFRRLGGATVHNCQGDLPFHEFRKATVRRFLGSGFPFVHIKLVRSCRRPSSTCIALQVAAGAKRQLPKSCLHEKLLSGLRLRNRCSDSRGSPSRSRRAGSHLPFRQRADGWSVSQPDYPLPRKRLAKLARLVAAVGVLLSTSLTLWYVRWVPTRTQAATVSLASIVAVLAAAGLTLPGRLAVGLLSAAATFAFFFGSMSVSGFGMLLIAVTGLAISALGLTLVAAPRDRLCVSWWQR